MDPVIIIPAHQEEAVLPRTLPPLLEGLSDGVRVILVPNGCSDRTAEVARALGGGRVEVIEIEEARKTAALNAGERVAGGYPRIYLDADIILRAPDAQRLLAALDAPGVLAAEPRARIDFDGCSLGVRAYYAVWVALHGQRPGDVGCGLYALTELGRQRFDSFPAVISDDGYVRAHFAPGEIVDVADAETSVAAPRNLRALIKIKTRSRLGALELARKFPDLWRRKRVAGQSFARKLRGLPLRLWPLVPLYLAVQSLTRRRAQARVADLDEYVWERDDSSR